MRAGPRRHDCPDFSEALEEFSAFLQTTSLTDASGQGVEYAEMQDVLDWAVNGVKCAYPLHCIRCSPAFKYMPDSDGFVVRHGMVVSDPGIVGDFFE